MSAEHDEMIKTLTAAGYEVFKVGTCRWGNIPHGRHSITTRSAMCPGSDPLPHGFQRIYMGSFGPHVACACGGHFRDYGSSEAGPLTTPWEEHKAANGVPTSPRPVPAVVASPESVEQP